MYKFLLLFILCIPLRSVAQKNKTKKTEPIKITTPVDYSIPLTPEKWQYQDGKAEFITLNGIPALKLHAGKGPAFIKDLVFSDGTIEYDVVLEQNLNLGNTPSIYFRSDQKDAELFYLRGRSNKPTANDAIQYAPIISDINMWDIYPEYQAPASFTAGEKSHIKLVIAGKQMRAYVNDMIKPALQIPHLEGKYDKGKVALDGAGIITNLQIKPGQIEDLPQISSPDLTDHDSHYLRAWKASKPVTLPLGQEVFAMALPKTDEFIDTIKAERRGLVNLTRMYGANDNRKVVWLKTNIRSNEALKTELQLGFSDEVWMFLNKKMVYVDKNLYLQNMRKNPDGRISILNSTIALNLIKGENELIIAVANDFYGWGIIARLENREGVVFE